MFADLLTPTDHALFGQIDPWVFLLVAAVAVLAGAAVQSMVGLGLGLVAAPVISFLDPTLMPGSLLITVIVLPVLTLVQDRSHIDWHGLVWGLPARIPGTVLAVWVVAVLEPRMLAGFVGVMVLLAVILTVWAFKVRVTPVSLVTAGLVSGFAGTATSVGGPPMALVYQNEPPERVRATLAAFFLCGGLISLVALGAGGQIDTRTVAAGIVAIPFVGLGFFLGNRVRRWVDPARLRIGLLTVVTLSALGLLAQAVFG